MSFTESEAIADEADAACFRWFNYNLAERLARIVLTSLPSRGLSEPPRVRALAARMLAILALVQRDRIQASAESSYNQSIQLWASLRSRRHVLELLKARSAARLNLFNLRGAAAALKSLESLTSVVHRDVELRRQWSKYFELMGDIETAIGYSSSLLRSGGTEPHWKAANLTLLGRQNALRAIPAQSRMKLNYIRIATEYLQESESILSQPQCRHDLFSVSLKTAWGFVSLAAEHRDAASDYASQATDHLFRIGAENPSLLRLKLEIDPASLGRANTLAVSWLEARRNQKTDPATAFLSLFQGMERLLDATAYVLGSSSRGVPSGAVQKYERAKKALKEVGIELTDVCPREAFIDLSAVRNAVAHSPGRQEPGCYYPHLQGLVRLLRALQQELPEEILEEAMQSIPGRGRRRGGTSGASGGK